MYNWSTDTTELKKHPEKYAIWRLEQLVNFGLNEEKISKKQLIQLWDKLTLDPKKKRFLAFLLWNKPPS